MKITIEFDGKGESGDPIVLEAVIQFALCGTMLQQGIQTVVFRRSVSDLDDPNYLIGLVGALTEDLRDHKSANPNSG